MNPRAVQHDGLQVEFGRIVKRAETWYLDEVLAPELEFLGKWNVFAEALLDPIVRLVDKDCLGLLNSFLVPVDVLALIKDILVAYIRSVPEVALV